MELWRFNLCKEAEVELRKVGGKAVQRREDEGVEGKWWRGGRTLHVFDGEGAMSEGIC